jgi:hypothetical protein
MKKFSVIALAGAAGVLAATGQSAMAALAQSSTDPNPLLSNVVDDGALGSGEYAATYANGGGTGFGGTLGAGTFYFDADATNLYVGFDPGADLNDIVALQLSTSTSGGFSDADMNDTGDGGRRAVSNLAGNANDGFPVLPEFGVAIGNFGVTVFQLNAGSTPNHLGFISFSNDQSGNSATLVREFAIPLATLGNPQTIEFFAGYVADDGFGSNESLPASTALNSGGNIGFDTTSAGYGTHNEFVIVPEPATAGLLTLGGLALLGRRGGNRRRG